MKKLMIAAAIVCAAAFVQAASCKWDAGEGDGAGWAWSYNADKGVNTYDDGSVGNYWLIALAANSTAGISVDNTGALVMNSSVGTAISATLGGQGSFNVPSEAMAFGNITAGLSEADNGKYFALVIYDSVNGLYGVSDTVMMAGIIDDPPNPGDKMRFSNHTADELLGNEDFGRYMVADLAVTTPSPEPTPEPTSGLLLLIGVAGLALRRRRA